MNGTVLLAVVLNGVMGILCVLMLFADFHTGWIICAALNFATIAFVVWMDWREQRRRLLEVFE